MQTPLRTIMPCLGLVLLLTPNLLALELPSRSNPLGPTIDRGAPAPWGVDPAGREPGQSLLEISSRDHDSNSILHLPAEFSLDDLPPASTAQVSRDPGPPTDPRPVLVGPPRPAALPVESNLADLLPIPEPSSLILLVTGAIGLVARRRLRRQMEAA